MSIPFGLHPPQSVADAQMPELLSFFCHWKDGREKGRKCGQRVSVQTQFTRFGVYLLVNQFIYYYIKNIIPTPAPDAKTIIDRRERC